MDSSSFSERECDATPDEKNNEANCDSNNILLPKSQEKYSKAYETFVAWKSKKQLDSLSQSVFLAYFSELSKTMKPSSLWSIHSMLKSTVYTKHELNISKYTKLTSFLKESSNGFRSLKSKVFTAQNVQTFLNEAPDYEYLVIKVSYYKI